MTFLQYQFHRAQSRLRTPQASGDVKAQKAVEPLFYQVTPGDEGFYEIPAYLRKEIHGKDRDNLRRMVDYVDRVRAHIRGRAA